MKTPVTAPPSAESALLRELAPRMMAVFVWMAHYYDARFEELGLTAASARALLQLDPAAPMPTKVLAERLSCDPSNVTPFVDRLEEAGLIERRVDRKDRRIKTLAITAAGRRMRERMTTIMAADTPPLQVLTTTEQRTLLDLLNKAWMACERDEGAIGEASMTGPEPSGTSGNGAARRSEMSE